MCIVEFRILRKLDQKLTPLRHPDPSPIQEQKSSIPTDEQRDVAIKEGGFERGLKFKGYRRGQSGEDEQLGSKNKVAEMVYAADEAHIQSQTHSLPSHSS